MSISLVLFVTRERVADSNWPATLSGEK